MLATKKSHGGMVFSDAVFSEILLQPTQFENDSLYEYVYIHHIYYVIFIDFLYAIL